MIGLLSEQAQIRTPDNINMCIECLDPGDTVLSAVVASSTIPNVQIKESKIVGITKMLCDHFNIINNTLIANDHQLVLVNREWYPIKELLSGSRLPQNISSNMVAQIIRNQKDEIVNDDIIELDRFDKQVDNVMYTLILDGPKTFFADGFIVKGE